MFNTRNIDDIIRDAGFEIRPTIIKAVPLDDEVTRALQKIAIERQSKCNHGVIFDAKAAKSMSVSEIRFRFPRLFGRCPKGCGYNGIAYASSEHYIMGDW